MPVLRKFDEEDMHRQIKWMERQQTVARLQAFFHAGHIELIDTGFTGLKKVGVRCGTEEFYDRSENYPSEGLVARVALAVASGRSCKNDPPLTSDTHMSDAFRYISSGAGKGNMMELMYGGGDKLFTAAVKQKKGAR